MTNLIRHIGKRKLTEISAGAGVPYRSVQTAVEGILPKAKNLQKLADFFGVSPDSLLRSAEAHQITANVAKEVVLRAFSDPTFCEMFASLMAGQFPGAPSHKKNSSRSQS